MPRVPTSPGVSNRIQTTSLTPTAATLATFDAIAGVVDKVSILNTEFQAKRKSQRDAEEFDNAIAGFTKDINDISQDVIRGDDIGSITDNFDERTSENFRSRLEQFESDEAKERFRSSATQLITSHRVNVDLGQFKREQAAGRIDLQRNLDDLGDAIVTAPNEAVANQLTEEAISSLRTSDLLLAEEVEPAIDAFFSSLDTKRINALVELADSSDSEAEAFEHLDAALELLDDPNALGTLSSKERTAFRRSVLEERNVLVKKFNQGKALDLSRDIKSATSQEDFLEISNRINDLLKSNVITEPAAITFDNQATRRRAQIADADFGALEVAFKIQAGIPIDPSNMKGIDAYFQEIFVPGLLGLSSDERDREIVRLVDSIDVIPGAVVKNLVSTASNGSTEAIASSAQFFDALRQASPQAVDRLPRDTSILFDNVVEAANLNVTPEESIKRFRESAKLNPSDRDARVERYNLEQSFLTDGEWLEDNLEAFSVKRPDAGFFEKLFTSSAGIEEIDIGLQGMFAAESQRNFILDPESGMDKARERAIGRWSQVTGVTGVGASPRLMYLPPEIVYPEFRGDSDAITKLLVDDVSGLAAADGISRKALASRLFIASDADTFKTGTYGIYLWDESFESSVLLPRDDGSVAKFFPEKSKPEVSEKQISEITEGVETAEVAQARAMRKLRISGDQTLRSGDVNPSISTAFGI